MRLGFFALVGACCVLTVAWLVLGFWLIWVPAGSWFQTNLSETWAALMFLAVGSGGAVFVWSVDKPWDKP